MYEHREKTMAGDKDKEKDRDREKEKEKEKERPTVTCRNCGHKGHLYRECPYPITSYGVICYRVDPKTDQHEYLMIQRKDSLSFMEFVRGKYDLKNIKYIKQLINDMTDEEKVMLIKSTFVELWNHVWCQQQIGVRHTNEFAYAKIKFEALKVGMYINKEFYNMSKIIGDMPSQYQDPEWGFPKGRRRLREQDIECALREFDEETGIHKNQIAVDKNLGSYAEVFFGTNHVLYKHVYFIAKMLEYDSSSKNVEVDTNNINQVREVRAVQWFTAPEILTHIRKHNQERRNIFLKVHKILDPTDPTDPADPISA